MQKMIASRYFKYIFKIIFMILGFSPHPQPLPKKGGEWCSAQLNTLNAWYILIRTVSSFPFWGRGLGGRGAELFSSFGFLSCKLESKINPLIRQAVNRQEFLSDEWRAKGLIRPGEGNKTGKKDHQGLF
jgi:hypothetical protein